MAETELGIPALLDIDDLTMCPDRLSILTYLSQFYHKFSRSRYKESSSNLLLYQSFEAPGHKEVTHENGSPKDTGSRKSSNNSDSGISSRGSSSPTSQLTELSSSSDTEAGSNSRRSSDTEVQSLSQVASAGIGSLGAVHSLVLDNPQVEVIKRPLNKNSGRRRSSRCQSLHIEPGWRRSHSPPIEQENPFKTLLSQSFIDPSTSKENDVIKSHGSSGNIRPAATSIKPKQSATTTSDIDMGRKSQTRSPSEKLISKIKDEIPLPSTESTAVESSPSTTSKLKRMLSSEADEVTRRSQSVPSATRKQKVKSLLVQSFQPSNWHASKDKEPSKIPLNTTPKEKDQTKTIFNILSGANFPSRQNRKPESSVQKDKSIESKESITKITTPIKDDSVKTPVKASLSYTSTPKPYRKKMLGPTPSSILCDADTLISVERRRRSRSQPGDKHARLSCHIELQGREVAKESLALRDRSLPADAITNRRNGQATQNTESCSITNQGVATTAKHEGKELNDRRKHSNDKVITGVKVKNGRVSGTDMQHETSNPDSSKPTISHGTTSDISSQTIRSMTRGSGFAAAIRHSLQFNDKGKSQDVKRNSAIVTRDQKILNRKSAFTKGVSLDENSQKTYEKTKSYPFLSTLV